MSIVAVAAHHHVKVRFGICEDDPALQEARLGPDDTLNLHTQAASCFKPEIRNSVCCWMAQALISNESLGSQAQNFWSGEKY